MRATLSVVGFLVLVLAPAASAETANVTRHSLANGLRVLIREDSSAGVVAISLQARAGSRFETAETAGIAAQGSFLSCLYRVGMLALTVIT